MHCSLSFFTAILLLIGGVFAAQYIPTEAHYREVDEKYLMTNQHIFAHLLIFSLISYLFLFPSDVFQGIGLTLENWASPYLGPRETDIVRYQCRKIVVHRAFLGCLPFLFCIMLWFSHENSIVFTSKPTRFIHYFATASSGLLIISLAYVLYARVTEYRTLTAIRTVLGHFDDLDNGVDSISTEYMLRDTIKHKISNHSRIAFGQTWIIYYTNFVLRIFRRADCRLRLEDAMDFNYLPDLSEVIQLITLVLEPPASAGKPIRFKCNNVEFRDYVNLLHIEMPSDIRLKFSLHEQFVKAFESEVDRNPKLTYENFEELDACLGCSARQPEVKLVKNCLRREDGTWPCNSCQCRPMWCLTCMARIFASKQNQETPDQWLNGTAPCPTCRQIFCIFDVHWITRPNGSPINEESAEAAETDNAASN